MKLLVRATNWVGDAVMSIPALEVVRRTAPDAEIAVLAKPGVADLYRGQAFADRVLPFESARRAVGLLHRERFDTALLLQNAFQAAWVAWRGGVRERIGYARDGRSALLTRAIAVPRRGETPAHEAYYYLELLRRAGWLAELPAIAQIRLRIEPVAVERAEQTLRAAGARPGALRVALAPGAAYGTAKCWPAERFAALADRLIADADADVILFGTDAERDVAARIISGMRHRPVNLAGETPIGDLAAFFAACRVFVGNDSGAAHVAAASGVPVVVIFGPTDAEATAPLTPRRSLIREPVSCSPCLLRQCPVDHRCMTRVEVEAVYAAVRHWLEHSKRG
jgi:heptosyltransferase II